MTDDHEIDLELEVPDGEGEWTELLLGDDGRAPLQRHPAGPRRRRRTAWVFAGVGAAGIGAVAAWPGGSPNQRSGASTTAARPASSVAAPGAVTTADTNVDATGQPMQPAPPPVGHPFEPARGVARVVGGVDGLALDAPTGLRLVALGARGGLFDIDVDTATVTVRDVSPQTQSGAPTWLIAGDHWVVVRPYDGVDNALVRDGEAPVPLDGALASGTPALLRGPGDTLWTQTLDGSAPLMVLVGLDGAALGPAVPTTDLQVVGADDDGALLVRGTGGTYAMGVGRDPGVPARVTTGEVLATGAGHLLLSECSEQLQCTRWLVDTRSGERVDLGPHPARGYGVEVGSISPDGRYALVLRTGGLRRWEVIGTTTPGVEPVPVPLLALDPELPASVAWSADGRYLVYLGARQLWLFDTTLGSDRPLIPVESGFPDVVMMAARQPG